VEMIGLFIGDSAVVRFFLAVLYKSKRDAQYLFDKH